MNREYENVSVETVLALHEIGFEFVIEDGKITCCFEEVNE